MSVERPGVTDPQIGSVVAELEERIVQQFPTATFDVFEGEDPEGTYLRATVDVDDPDLVTDLVIDRLLDLQVEARLPLYFIAARPVERALAEVQTRRPARPYVGSPAART